MFQGHQHLPMLKEPVFLVLQGPRGPQVLQVLQVPQASREKALQTSTESSATSKVKVRALQDLQVSPEQSTLMTSSLSCKEKM